MKKNLDDMQAENPGQGFQFPGAFEITAVGKAHAGLEERVPELVVGPGFVGAQRQLADAAVERRMIMFRSVSPSLCPSREKYEAAHAALRADPAVRWTLVRIGNRQPGAGSGKA